MLWAYCSAATMAGQLVKCLLFPGACMRCNIVLLTIIVLGARPGWWAQLTLQTSHALKTLTCLQIAELLQHTASCSNHPGTERIGGDSPGTCMTCKRRTYNQSSSRCGLTASCILVRSRELVATLHVHCPPDAKGISKNCIIITADGLTCSAQQHQRDHHLNLALHRVRNRFESKAEKERDK